MLSSVFCYLVVMCRVFSAVLLRFTLWLLFLDGWLLALTASSERQNGVRVLLLPFGLCSSFHSPPYSFLLYVVYTTIFSTSSVLHSALHDAVLLLPIAVSLPSLQLVPFFPTRSTDFSCLLNGLKAVVLVGLFSPILFRLCLIFYTI